MSTKVLLFDAKMSWFVLVVFEIYIINLVYMFIGRELKICVGFVGK